MLKLGKYCAFWVNFLDHIVLWSMMQPHVKYIQVQWSGRVLAPVSTICQMRLSDSFPGDRDPTFAEKLLKENVVILPSDSGEGDEMTKILRSILKINLLTSNLGMAEICQRYADICLIYAQDMPKICPRYA